MINRTDLDKIDLFKALKPATCLSIIQLAFKRDLSAGKELVSEGMSADHCYFLVTGHVRVLRISRDGRLQVLGRFGPGAPLNIIPLLVVNGVNQATIETLTPVSVLVLDTNGFKRLVSMHPDFSVMLLHNFAERMTRMTNLAAGLSFHSVRIRLARFLMELASQPYDAGGWTQDEIAAHIGTIRDIVGRLLREFEAKGLIKRNRQEITLLDRVGLLKEAEFGDNRTN